MTFVIPNEQLATLCGFIVGVMFTAFICSRVD